MPKFTIKKVTGDVTSVDDGQVCIRSSSDVRVRGNLSVKEPDSGGVIESGFPWLFMDRDDLRQQQLVGTGHPFNVIQNNGTFVIHSWRNAHYYPTPTPPTATTYPDTIAEDITCVGGASVSSAANSDIFRHVFQYNTDEERLEAERLFATMGRACGFANFEEWKHWLVAEGTFDRGATNARYGAGFWIPMVLVPSVPSTPPVVIGSDTFHLVAKINPTELESGPYYSFAIWLRSLSGKLLIYSQNIGASDAKYDDPMEAQVIDPNPDRYTYVSGSAESDPGYVIPPIRIYATADTKFKLALPFIGIGRKVMMPWHHQVPVSRANKLNRY